MTQPDRVRPELQSILTALSLDCGRLLWEASGLRVTHDEARVIVSAARTALEELEQDAESPYSIDYSPERARVIAESFYVRLAGSIGSEAVASVSSWAGRLIAARVERDWLQGTFACNELVNDPLYGHATLLLDESDRRHLLRLIESHLRAPVAHEVAREAERPQSEFDRRQFKRVAETGPPANSIHHLVLRERYEELVKSIQLSLSTRGAQSFFSWLNQRIAELNRKADS